MIDALIQSTVLFALVAIVTKLLKRSAPASFRHMLWAFAIVAALVAPLIARVSPLHMSVLPATTAPGTQAHEPAKAPPAIRTVITRLSDRVVKPPTNRSGSWRPHRQKARATLSHPPVESPG